MIIAVAESDQVNGTYTICGGNHRKRRAITGPGLIQCFSSELVLGEGDLLATQSTKYSKIFLMES